MQKEAGDSPGCTLAEMMILEGEGVDEIFAVFVGVGVCECGLHSIL